MLFTFKFFNSRCLCGHCIQLKRFNNLTDKFLANESAVNNVNERSLIDWSAILMNSMILNAVSIALIGVNRGTSITEEWVPELINPLWIMLTVIINEWDDP